MCPHQQQYPPFNFQQQHQQLYYSSTNRFLFSFPTTTATSDSSLHPPGTDPLSNSNPYSSSYAPPQSTHSHNWVIKQAEPIRYNPAVGSSNETSAASASFPSTWNAATWAHQPYATDTMVMLPNGIRITKPLRCDVCKIDCNSKDVYENHLLGKRHKRNLQVQINPTIAFVPESSHANVQSYQSVIGSVSNELVPMKQVVSSGGASADSAKVCTVCNVVCNSQDVYNKHLYGKKHAAQVALLSNNGIGPYDAEFKRCGIGPWKKAPKKVKIAQSAWCDVCKINCTSRDAYITHLAGKKHLKNTEKLSNPKIEASTGATSSNALQGTANPVIGPLETPKTSKSKKSKASELDIETKKRKVVEGGAAAEAVKLCTLCNVVCNSQIVFDAHLVGHKHVAMLKKAGTSIVG